MDSFERLTELCSVRPPIAALVLGTGLNQGTDEWPLTHAVAFGDLPGLPAAGVAGHRGTLCLFEAEHGPLLVFQGRLHFYEGHSWEVVARPVQLAHELGARALILTNASGGIGSAQTPGSLMAVRDHIAAMTPSWWRQPARPSPYSPRLLDLILRSAPAAGIEAPVGVYACVTGPCYETPAEIRALRAIGADAVGMSTVHEANVAAELGMEVAAISYVANRAAGLSPTPLSHIDVLQTVTAVAGRLSQLLREIIRGL